MTPSSNPIERRHDLDALRAAAMLVGVAFHAAHSFAPGMPWPVHDTQQSPWWYLVLFAVHGCRMQIFFLLSGYFTALLFERHGLQGLLYHRLTRIGGPLFGAMAVLIVGLPWVIHQFNPAIPFRLPQWNDPGLFSYLWFLWFLLWLVGAFCLVISFARFLKWSPDVRKVVSWPGVLVALIFSAALLKVMSRAPHISIGPDTSPALIPDFKVLGCYAVFFAFGACGQRVPVNLSRLAATWRWQLPLALLVWFPVSIALVTPAWPHRANIISPTWSDSFAMVTQALYAWSMCLGFIGLVETYLAKPLAWIRYFADASYWIYLTHLPLVTWSQFFVSQFAWNGFLKFTLITSVDLIILSLLYRWVIRDYWIGRLLNGPKLKA